MQLDEETTETLTQLMLKAVLVKYGGQIRLTRTDLKLAAKADGWQATHAQDGQTTLLELAVDLDNESTGA